MAKVRAKPKKAPVRVTKRSPAKVGSRHQKVKSLLKSGIKGRIK